ncbi:chitin disaccharide deacetylase [Desemzia sp. RIT804]|uniref:chitin disaccharide deacetylase n=1 Tax=Desemzia sp. RIT 804 TaxID=2810209 RepID=UPI00194E6A37|nr:chitin disaccharide deacetylase [Desemzia sp. RIT 804]MBM6615344.1 chitin disaccharide deacetylase [Desemzia sp. RIT 804]
MKKLIINADDFGYCKGVNYGIIEAYSDGVLTSTTMMANMPGFDQAVDLHKQYPGLGIGIHLVLTTGRPLLKNLKTIVDADGNFRNQAYYKGSFIIDQQEIYDEWKAQIEKILAAGIQPTHVDTHHHANLFGDFNEIYLHLADEYQLPVRNNFQNQDASRRTTDGFVYTMETVIQTTETLEQLFETQDSVEIMCHPAFLDKFLLNHSSYTYPRTEELELLTHPTIKDLFSTQDTIELTTFKSV